jgi:hypothetical protein
MNPVPFQESLYLFEKGYTRSSLYVYWRDTQELHFWIDPENNLHQIIPAPTITEAIEYLWQLRIKLAYELLEGEYCRGLIWGNGKKITLPDQSLTPQEALEKCLTYCCCHRL